MSVVRWARPAPVILVRLMLAYTEPGAQLREAKDNISQSGTIRTFVIRQETQSVCT